jgi:hypothetical protein
MLQYCAFRDATLGVNAVLLRIGPDKRNALVRVAMLRPELLAIERKATRVTVNCYRWPLWLLAGQRGSENTRPDPRLPSLRKRIDRQRTYVRIRRGHAAIDVSLRCAIIVAPHMTFGLATILHCKLGHERSVGSSR